MSHFFRILLSIFVLLLAAFVLMGIFAPKNFKVQRTKTIQAPVNIVWTQVTNLKNWANWSPWAEMDPSLKNTYSGKDGDVGAKMSWVGDDTLSGTGELNIESISLNKEMLYNMSFKIPLEMSSTGTMKFSNPTDSSIDLTWIDYADLPFKLRPFMHFWDMDKMVGPQFERGLAKLDSVSHVIYSKLKN